MFSTIRPTPEEISAPLPGDDIVPTADVVMDRAFTLAGSTEIIWPWFVQLGKHRAGWYLPRSVERCMPSKKRALHVIDPKLQNLAVGMVIDDWGGKTATFEVAILKPPHVLVYTSKRGRTNVSWAIILTAESPDTTRVQFRLRLAPVRRKWLAQSFGNFIDAATIAGLAAGLRERLKAR